MATDTTAAARRTVVSCTGDGWDFLRTLSAAGWRAVRVWGRDGWDLGAWPDVIVAVRRCLHSPRIEVCEFVRGDLTITTWPDVGAATRHVDGLAAAWWERTGRGPTDPADGLGPHGDSLV